MTDAVELRKTLEADLAKAPRIGPAQDYVEMVQVPGRTRPVKMTFKLSDRKNHRLFYTADCPRLDCPGGEITVETRLGNYGRTIWPVPYPQLCEACENKLDLMWEKAKGQQHEQLKERRRASQ